MRWPWQQSLASFLREMVDGQMAVIENLRAENISLREGLVRIQQHRDSTSEYAEQSAKLWATQVDYWKRLAETLLDKEAVAATGVPIFRQAAIPAAPSEQPPAEPTAEDLRRQDEEELPDEMPRAALLRNPRKHAHHVTLAHTIDHNRKTVTNSVREASNQVFAALDEEAQRRAKLIQTPAPEKTG